MDDLFVTFDTLVSLTPRMYDRISACADDLGLSFESVLMAVVNESVRRHLEHICSDNR